MEYTPKRNTRNSVMKFIFKKMETIKRILQEYNGELVEVHSMLLSMNIAHRGLMQEWQPRETKQGEVIRTRCAARGKPQPIVTPVRTYPLMCHWS